MAFLSSIDREKVLLVLAATGFVSALLVLQRLTTPGAGRQPHSGRGTGLPAVAAAGARAPTVPTGRYGARSASSKSREPSGTRSIRKESSGKVISRSASVANDAKQRSQQQQQQQQLSPSPHSPSPHRTHISGHGAADRHSSGGTSKHHHSRSTSPRQGQQQQQQPLTVQLLHKHHAREGTVNPVLHLASSLDGPISAEDCLRGGSTTATVGSVTGPPTWPLSTHHLPSSGDAAATAPPASGAASNAVGSANTVPVEVPAIPSLGEVAATAQHSYERHHQHPQSSSKGPHHVTGNSDDAAVVASAAEQQQQQMDELNYGPPTDGPRSPKPGPNTARPVPSPHSRKRAHRRRVVDMAVQTEIACEVQRGVFMERATQTAVVVASPMPPGTPRTDVHSGSVSPIMVVDGDLSCSPILFEGLDPVGSPLQDAFATVSARPAKSSAYVAVMPRFLLAKAEAQVAALVADAMAHPADPHHWVDVHSYLHQVPRTAMDALVKRGRLASLVEQAAAFSSGGDVHAQGDLATLREEVAALLSGEDSKSVPHHFVCVGASVVMREGAPSPHKPPKTGAFAHLLVDSSSDSSDSESNDSSRSSSIEDDDREPHHGDECGVVGERQDSSWQRSSARSAADKLAKLVQRHVATLKHVASMQFPEDDGLVTCDMLCSQQPPSLLQAEEPPDSTVPVDTSSPHQLTEDETVRTLLHSLVELKTSPTFSAMRRAPDCAVFACDFIELATTAKHLLSLSGSLAVPGGGHFSDDVLTVSTHKSIPTPHMAIEHLDTLNQLSFSIDTSSGRSKEASPQRSPMLSGTRRLQSTYPVRPHHFSRNSPSGKSGTTAAATSAITKGSANPVSTPPHTSPTRSPLSRKSSKPSTIAGQPRSGRAAEGNVFERLYTPPKGTVVSPRSSPQQSGNGALATFI